MGEKAEVYRTNVLEDVFHAWLRIICKFGIRLSQSQQDPVDFDRNLMVIQGSQVQKFLEGCLLVFIFGGVVQLVLWRVGELGRGQEDD